MSASERSSPTELKRKSLIANNSRYNVGTGTTVRILSRNCPLWIQRAAGSRESLPVLSRWISGFMRRFARRTAQYTTTDTAPSSG